MSLIGYDEPLVNASAEQLRARHLELQAEFKRHGDEETLALSMAWLALVAIERVRQMEESHRGTDLADSPDRNADRDPDPDARPADVRRGPGGGWYAAGPPKTSVRPH